MKKFVLPLITLALLTASCKKEKNDVFAYQVNEENSVAIWKGSTSATSNTGSFQVTSTEFTIENDEIKKGKFIIPIISVKNFNLPDDIKDMLLNHLKSPDFFNMAVHPNATFELSRVAKYIGNGTGAIPGANKFVTGNFTMIGKTLPVNFPAKIDFVNDSIHVEATFKLDRTKWGMNYSSDPELGEHYIYKDVDIHLKISAGRK